VPHFLTPCLIFPPNTVNFDEQLVLSQNSLAHANPYYPVPVPSPPWMYPSPSSDTSPPTSTSPSSALTNYTTPARSPPAATELVSNVLDAHTQDGSVDAEPSPRSPRVTRNAQGSGRRPGACSRCKKLKVRSSIYCVEMTKSLKVQPHPHLADAMCVRI
jgi:hypothetical protein